VKSSVAPVVVPLIVPVPLIAVNSWISPARPVLLNAPTRILAWLPATAQVLGEPLPAQRIVTVARRTVPLILAPLPD
jgi:hypothetical protein